jgi:hypothetical protein
MKNIFLKPVFWNEKNKDKEGLPRPIAITTYNYSEYRRLGLAKKVPIPWQSKPAFKEKMLLSLNIENENKIYKNEVCPYCGIKFQNNDNTIRWITSDFKKVTEIGPVVFSDFYPFHIECMKQARTFCPFMKKLKDIDFEKGPFIKLKNNAIIDKEVVGYDE